MGELRCEFYAAEDGEPWCAFAWGHHDPKKLNGRAVRRRIQDEMELFDFDQESLDLIKVAMRRQASHLWLIPIDEDEQFYRFCAEGDPGALAITGWRLCSLPTPDEQRASMEQGS